MAKGSNNARSKKTHSSKPYDVSNSFVRKVASRVTSLIPQPSWLSKWFVSSNEGDTTATIDEEEPEANVADYRSSKRAKIDLNRPFPTNSFRVAPACDEVLSTGGEERETRYSTHSLSVKTTRYSPQRNSNQLSRLSPQRVSDDLARFSPQRSTEDAARFSPQRSTEDTARFSPQKNTDDSVRFPSERFTNESVTFSLQRISESDRQCHKTSDEPIAGPSGLNRSQTGRANFPSAHRNIRPRSSLSTFLNQSNSSSSHLERKMNGDNASESSESTSGCSSLPHPLIQQTSHNKASSANKNYDSPALSHSHRSLLLNRTRSPRTNTPLSRRRTLFSLSAFGSPSLESDSSLSKSAVINSPFYLGRTGYGGASAHRRSHDFTPEVHSYRSSSVEVHPVNSGPSDSSSNLATMSHTTRRIMEALEQFASPVQSTRKIVVDTPTLPVLATKRPHTELKITEEKSSLRQLTIPTVPDLIKLRRREKLQDSLESARLIATATENSYQLRVEDNSRTGKVIGRKANIEDEETVREVNLPSISLPITVLPKFDIQVPPQHTSTLHHQAPQQDKVIAQQKDGAQQQKQQQDKAQHGKTQPNKARHDNATRERVPRPTSTFIFSPPIILNNVPRTKSSAKKYTFTFHPPIILHKNSEKLPNANREIKDAKEIINQPKLEAQVSTTTNETGSSVTNSSKTNENNFTSFKFAPPDYKMSNTIPNFKTSNVAKSDIISDSIRSENCTQNILPPSENNKTVTPSKSLSDIMKPSSDTWECGTCLIRNKLSVSRCIACTAPRESHQSAVTTTVSLPVQNVGSVNSLTSHEPGKTEKPDSNKFKIEAVGNQKNLTDLNGNTSKKDKWECPTCWIKNPETSLKCQACETCKPQDNSKPNILSSFGNKVSKPTETWECPTCMIRNKNEILKCAACEEPKPGSAVTSTSKSTLKFNVAIPAEASKFTFGVTNNSNSNVSVMSEPTKEFKFGEMKTGTETSSFTFGVGDSSVRTANSSTIDRKSGFTFGIPQSSSTAITNSLSNKAAGDGIGNTDGDTSKSSNTSISSDKQSSPEKINPNFNASSANTGKLEKNQSLFLNSQSTIEAGKIEAETAAVNFKFSVPSNSDSIQASNSFSFGMKPNSISHQSAPTEGSLGVNDKKNSSEVSGKLEMTSLQTNEHNDKLKLGKCVSIVGTPSAPATGVSVPTTSVNTFPTSKALPIKSPQIINANAVTNLPDTVPRKEASSSLSLPTSQKSADETLKTSDSHSLSPGKTSAVKSLFSNSTPQSMFGSSHSVANSNVAETAVPKFTNATLSVQQTGAVNKNTNDSTSFGGSTASGISFTSTPLTTAQAFGSKVSLSFSAPSTTVTNFGSDKSVMSFGSSNAQSPNAATSAFTSPQVTPSPGNLFGTQKFNSSETAPNTFNANAVPNFGTPTGNLAGFGTQSTTSQPFGTPVTTPAFGLSAPSFGATSTQNFGAATTSAPSFGTSVPGAFNAKPPSDTTVKVSSTVTPFGFSVNPSSAPSFSFGSAQSNPSELSGPPAKQPSFTFGNGNSSAPVGQSSGFGFGAFASNSAPTSSGGPAAPLFGSGSTASPAFGSGSSTGFTAPSFFGQTSQPNNNVFGFSSNQGTSGTQPSQNAVPAFNFSSSQPSAPPTFNPNVKPTFNFTGGSTPNFTAEATASPPPTQRRIKKAVRRTQARTNVM